MSSLTLVWVSADYFRDKYLQSLFDLVHPTSHQTDHYSPLQLSLTLLYAFSSYGTPFWLTLHLFVSKIDLTRSSGILMFFRLFSLIIILLWGSNSFRLGLYDFIILNLHFWQFECIELLQFHLCRLSLYFKWALSNFKLRMRSQCFSFISCRLWHFSMWRFHFSDSFFSRWILFCGWIITRSKLCVRGLNKFLLSILQRRIRDQIDIVCIGTLLRNFSL